MDETFELPVHFNGQDLLLPAQLRPWRNGHQILVTIGDQIIIFEPDEERNYRALLPDPGKEPDLSLIQSIATTIESLFK